MPKHIFNQHLNNKEMHALNVIFEKYLTNMNIKMYYMFTKNVCVCGYSSPEHPASEVSMKDPFSLLLPRDFSDLSEGGSMEICKRLLAGFRPEVCSHGQAVKLVCKSSFLLSSLQ